MLKIILEIITERFDKYFSKERMSVCMNKEKIDGLEISFTNLILDLLLKKIKLSEMDIRLLLNKLMDKYLPIFKKEVDQTISSSNRKCLFELRNHQIINNKEVEEIFMNSDYPKQIKEDLEKFLSENKVEV